MRRNRLDLISKAERSIYDAMQEVEKLGASVLLTDAITKLSEAKDLVSDYIDGEIESQDSTPTDPPPVVPGGPK